MMRRLLEPRSLEEKVGRKQDLGPRTVVTALKQLLPFFILEEMAGLHNQENTRALYSYGACLSMGLFQLVNIQEVFS